MSLHTYNEDCCDTNNVDPTRFRNVSIQISLKQEKQFSFQQLYVKTCAMHKHATTNAFMF